MTQLPRVVCLGPLVSGLALGVERYPAANGGTFIRETAPYLGADAAMVALALANWGWQARLICNDLGDDGPGRAARETLDAAGVAHGVQLMAGVATPLEVDVCDRAGTRTWFVEERWQVFNTILQSDLDGLAGAALLYIDWYAGDDIVRRGLAAARAAGVPVFLNVEYSARAPAFAGLLDGVALAQTWVNDDDPHAEDGCAVAAAMRAAGVQTALVTRGKFGALAALADGSCIAAPALPVEIAGTIGAGAIFAAGFIHGHLSGWPALRSLRFATAAASLKCAALAPRAPGPDAIARALGG